MRGCVGWLGLGLLLLPAMLALSCRSLPPACDFAWEGETMGSAYHIKLARARLTDSQLEQLKAAVEARLREVNGQMSHYQPDSELSRFNRHASMAPFPVSPEFARVTRFSMRLHQQSGGVFDPTLGPLINLWGFGQQGETIEPPSPERVAEALRSTGCRHLEVTPAGALRKDIPQLEINLSAVAKGFGVDEAARVLRSRGVKNLFVEIGGEVVAAGVNAEGRPWRVGIESPERGIGFGQSFAAVVPLADAALATSGNYRKFYTDAQGRLYSHILDPATGQPVRHDLVSVSVVARDCLTADGLATALFVLGDVKGLPWIEAQPEAAALFIVREPDGTFRRIASARFPAGHE